jgi:hypothetical protein
MTIEEIWQQIWQRKSDQELEDAARNFAEYTLPIQKVIRAELYRRGMPESLIDENSDQVTSRRNGQSIIKTLKSVCLSIAKILEFICIYLMAQSFLIFLVAIPFIIAYGFVVDWLATRNGKQR